MNRPYKPYLMFVPVLFLGIVAYAARPTPTRPKTLSPAEIAQKQREADAHVERMRRIQWQSHQIELKVMADQMKHAKHIIVEDGSRYPSETDETDDWFQSDDEPRGKAAGARAEATSTHGLKQPTASRGTKRATDAGRK